MGWFKFYLLYEALSTQHLSMMRNYGYEYEDEIVVGDMELYLLRGSPHLYPPEYQWHLAVQRSGMNVFNADHQFGREDNKRTRRARGEKGAGMTELYAMMEPMLKKIQEWTQKYGQLVIASTNEELTEKWIANVTMMSRYLGIPIHTETASFYGHTLHIIKSD